MRKRTLLLLTVLLACAACAPTSAESIVDAPPTCRVWINGVEAQVRETAVNHQRVWTSRPMLSTSPVVLFTAEGRVEIEVAFLGTEVESAVVRPLSLGVTPDVSGGVVRFALNSPANAVVEYNGQVKGALHLFLSAPETDAPKPGDPNVRYLGPGIHDARVIVPNDGETIYLAEGCVLRGAVQAEERHPMRTRRYRRQHIRPLCRHAGSHRLSRKQQYRHPGRDGSRPLRLDVEPLQV